MIIKKEDFLFNKNIFFLILIVFFMLAYSNLFVSANDVGAVRITSINGTDSWGALGASLASGDVNNDGYADMIIGAPYNQPSGITDGGQVFVFFGSSSGIPDADVTGANMTLNYSGPSNGALGIYVASGDINGDGYDDIIAGAYWGDTPAGDPGQAFVFFGDNYTQQVNKIANDYANITINGTKAGDWFGYPVASGDVNNDGYSDMIIGATYTHPAGVTHAGQVLVFFGENYTSIIGADAFSFANITFNGTGSEDYFGFYVSSGDVNSDGYVDIITGAVYSDPSGVSDAGQAFVFFGDNYTNIVNENVSSYANITINGTCAADNFGYSTYSSDVNNDGYSDLIIGAHTANATNSSANVMDDAGQAFVFFGDNYTSIINQDTSYANITLNGTSEGEWFADYIISDDINNDGYADMIISLRGTDADITGQVLVFFGDNYTTTINQDAYPYANITINGTESISWFGVSTASGDVDNDGYKEILAGAHLASPSGIAYAGQAFVYAYDNIAPAVNLNPADNTYDSDGLDIIFSFSAAEPHPDICTLYFSSNSTNWAYNQSVVYSNNIQANFTTMNLSDGAYTWNVECNDTAFNSAFNNTNFTLTVDTTAPETITFTEPTNKQINIRDSITYTCESSDITSGIKSWKWTLNKPDTKTTKTGGSENKDTITFSGDDTNAAGTYTLKCEVEDKASWTTSSPSKTFEVFYSTALDSGGGGGSGITDVGSVINLENYEETNINGEEGKTKEFTFDGLNFHTITFEEVNENSVTLLIQSNPIRITLKIGETKETDINSDGINDISITLNAIKDGSVDLTTKKINNTKKPPQKQTQQQVQNEQPKEKATSGKLLEETNKVYLLVPPLAVIVIVISFLSILKKKKKIKH